MDKHRDVDMHLNLKMSFSGLKYMSQDDFCAIRQIVQKSQMRTTITWL